MLVLLRINLKFYKQKKSDSKRCFLISISNRGKASNEQWSSQPKKFLGGEQKQI
jgi:hypothetical protein